METVTFDKLPEMVSELCKKVDILNSLLTNTLPEKGEDYLMAIEQFREYLPEHPAKQTIYQWIYNRSVPYEKYGKRVYFRKSNIDNWLNNGRQI
jgi:hypothetical protein